MWVGRRNVSMMSYSVSRIRVTFATVSSTGLTPNTASPEPYDKPS